MMGICIQDHTRLSELRGDKSVLPSSLSFSIFSVLAGNKWSILPQKEVPSSSVYAFTACSGIMNVTVAKPFGCRSTGSIGMLTSVSGPGKAIKKYVNYSMLEFIVYN